MGNYFKTIYLFAATQLRRLFRDPVTILILMGLPIALLLIFGSLNQNGGNVTLRTAVFNHSDSQFSKEFEKNLKDMEVLKVSEDDKLTLDSAKEKMSKSELDTIIEIPAQFGQTNDKNIPSGKLIVYQDKANQQTGQIVDAVMNSVVDGYNEQLVGKSDTPLTIDRAEISGNSSIKSIHYILAVFGGMALLMIGIFGVALALPADKKAGILRRMHVTPLKASQVHLGTMLSFAVLGVIVMTLLTALAMTLFGMEIKGDLVSFVLFILLGLALVLGFGLAIAGIAKNTSQAEVIGQVVFMASLGLSGMWVPIVLMPEILQSIASFAPLTLIVEGIQRTAGEGAGLVDLLPEIGIMAAWIVVVYGVGIKMFRWE